MRSFAWCRLKNSEGSGNFLFLKNKAPKWNEPVSARPGPLPLSLGPEVAEKQTSQLPPAQGCLLTSLVLAYP